MEVLPQPSPLLPDASRIPRSNSLRSVTSQNVPTHPVRRLSHPTPVRRCSERDGRFRPAGRCGTGGQLIGEPRSEFQGISDPRRSAGCTMRARN